MDLEELREEQPGIVCQVPAAPVFDLREIRLAERTARFFLDRADDFLLRHFAPDAAQRAFHLPQVL